MSAAIVRVLADDGTLDWDFVRGTATVLLNLSVAIIVAGWSWVWATWPVNDSVGARWSDADWNMATRLTLLRTLLRAILMFAALFWVNRHLLRPITPRPHAALIIAAGAAVIVLVIGAAGAVSFWRERPIF